ncbi:Biotin synthesis protein BioC [Thermodesulfovibrio sp. N1]|uniref:L-histidine N(alpha)-methyltransferase n=1 Tax=unclassified Thermodesulfovibrio TaxID=2645936 RepID=UPI00083B7A6C|nr:MULTISPECIES: L-histidine N(alpha)-methyltransferase [unclassified Thermodesulfovibrio]MDI1472856.1 methyltransferase domain-containing protein [Thermodesulfovibrio sp. 1176]ODA44511.1 Biotin synthesis protein BioC [Thermodesulfovibrio sp. N1]
MKGIGFYFDKAVNTYEKAGNIQKKVAIKLAQSVKEGFYPTVVEIGSGKGFITDLLIKKISYNRYINIDISYEFLKRLKSRFNEKSLFINAKAEQLPLKEGIANLIVSSSSLHWIEEPERVFNKLFNLMEVNGRFYFSIFLSGSLAELKKASEISNFGSVFPLKSSQFYIDLLNSINCIKWQFSIEIYREIFPTVKDFLLSHKLTGTNFTKNKKFSGKESYAKFCTIYKEMFSNHEGVYATYEVLFIEGQKVSPCLQY